MRILFIIRSLENGGAERQLVCLSKLLKDKGHLVNVLVFYKDGFYKNELIDNGIEVIEVCKKGRWDILGFAYNTFSRIRAEKPDIIHGYLPLANIISALSGFFLKRSKIVFGIRAADTDFKSFDWLVKVSYRLECLLSKRADLIISNSEAGKRFAVSNGFPESKFAVVPNGIDTEKFCMNKSLGLPLRQKWGIGRDEILIGMVARIDPMKDHITFIGAYKLICQSVKKIRFVCIGDGNIDHKKKVFSFCEKEGIGNGIIWAGQMKDVTAVYNALDIFTLTSVGEGFPNVIGEAMSCGLPCVVTDVGDSAMLVGNTGIVVPPRDPEKIADAWEKLLKGNIKEMGIKARKRILDNFGVGSLLKNTEDALGL